jgi:hypothetical protein
MIRTSTASSSTRMAKVQLKIFPVRVMHKLLMTTARRLRDAQLKRRAKAALMKSTTGKQCAGLIGI